MKGVVKRGSRLLAGLVAVSLAVGVCAQPATSVGGFDFAYRIAGDTRARPVQVFGDSSRTYFQFAPGQAVPLILAGPARDRVLPMAEGPYHVVAGKATHYTLVFAGAQARVERSGAGPAHAATPFAEAIPPEGHGMPPARDRTAGSHATPVRGDVIAWTDPDRFVEQQVVFEPRRYRVPRAAAKAMADAARSLGPEAVVELRGAPADDGLADRRLQAVVRVLVRAGVPAGRVQRAADGPPLVSADVVALRWRAPGRVATSPVALHQAVPPDPTAFGRPAPGHFDLLLSDRTVSASLRRWAAGTGHRLEWATATDAPIVGELTVHARQFPAAVHEVIGGLRSLGYPLAVSAAEDGVVRVHDAAGP